MNHQTRADRKRPESLIASALARAYGAMQAMLALKNRTNPIFQVNAAPLGPAQVVDFQANGPVSNPAGQAANFQVFGVFSGTTSAPGTPVTVRITANGVAVGAIVLPANDAVSGHFSAMVPLVNSRAIGAPAVTYGIQADAGVGNTVTVSAGAAGIEVYGLPV